MALDQAQLDQLTTYVEDNPDAIPEFDSSTTPNRGWSVASNDVVVTVMNTEGKVAGQTLARELLPTADVLCAIHQTRASASPAYTDYQTRSTQQLDLLRNYLVEYKEFGIPITRPEIDDHFRWIFEGASDTLAALGTYRDRPATPAESLYSEEGIVVTLDDVRKARP